MYCIFIEIMARLFSDIFPTFVFNNIMAEAFTFSPRAFLSPIHSNSDNLLNYNNLWNSPIHDNNR